MTLRIYAGRSGERGDLLASIDVDLRRPSDSAPGSSVHATGSSAVHRCVVVQSQTGATRAPTVDELLAAGLA